MYKLLPFLLFLACLIACGDSNSSETATTTAPSEKTTATAPQGEQLGSVPFEDIKNLFDNCDYIDYVFYTANFSISQNEKASIQTAISHIAKAPATLNPACKPMGRVFYQIEGKNVMEADMYFQEGCTYYVFLKNNKPAYANLMTDEGIGYFNNIIQRASTVGQQAQ